MSSSSFYPLLIWHVQKLWKHHTWERPGKTALGFPDAKSKKMILGRKLVTNEEQRIWFYQISWRLPNFMRLKGFIWEGWQSGNVISRLLSLTGYNDCKRYLTAGKKLIQHVFSTDHESKRTVCFTFLLKNIYR